MRILVEGENAGYWPLAPLLVQALQHHKSLQWVTLHVFKLVKGGCICNFLDAAPSLTTLELDSWSVVRSSSLVREQCIDEFAEAISRRSTIESLILRSMPDEYLVMRIAALMLIPKRSLKLSIQFFCDPFCRYDTSKSIIIIWPTVALFSTEHSALFLE